MRMSWCTTICLIVWLLAVMWGPFQLLLNATIASIFLSCISRLLNKVCLVKICPFWSNLFCIFYCSYQFNLIHYSFENAACGFGTWPDIGRHKIWIWKGIWWYSSFDWRGWCFLSLSLKSHHHEQIWCLCVNFRSILLIQVDIGLLILMRNALGTALNLKMLTRCVIYSIRSTCYSSSIPACAFMC